MDLAVALAAWALHGACVPSSNNAQQGDASVRVTPADGTETAFNHAQGRSQVSVTPPEGGVFTAVFVHNDPAMTLSLRVDSNAVKEGDLVRFPLGGGVTNNDLLVQVDYQGRSYRSDQGLARGDLSFEILQVAEEGVDFRGTFNLVLATSDGTTAAVVGFLEAHEGAAESTLLDAGS
jgi:hypothetical protein